VRLQIAIPEGDVSTDVLNGALEAVTRLDEHQIATGRAPTFAKAVHVHGLRWRPEPPGAERFDHAQMIVGRKWGDCDDIAPHHAASLRVQGIDPGARAIAVPTSRPRRYHAVVERSDGRIVDPSRYAGMGRGGEVGIAAPVCAPMMRGYRPQIALQPSSVSGEWHARADLPCGDGYALASTATREDKLAAVRDAVSGACLVGDLTRAASRADVAKMLAAEAILSGESAHNVARMLERRGVAVVGELYDDLQRFERDVAPRVHGLPAAMRRRSPALAGRTFL
jgi:hypothetical protein